MSEWNTGKVETEKSADYWNNQNCGSFNFVVKEDENNPSKHNFDNIKQYSARSVKPKTEPISIPKFVQSKPGAPVSISPDNDMEICQLKCTSCGNLIIDMGSTSLGEKKPEPVKYEGNNIFTDENCWQDWINKMIYSEDIRLKDLWSMESKRYLLTKVCSMMNGQLIMRVILMLKSALGEYNFGLLICDNPVAMNHYIEFLRESHESDEKLLRMKGKIEEPMKVLRTIMNDNFNVTPGTVHIFIRKLHEFCDEITLNDSLAPIQKEMIEEYATLLDWQAKYHESLINFPLTATVIETKLAYQSAKEGGTLRLLRERFRFTPEEYFWTALKPIVMNGKFNEIEKALNNKDFGGKPDVTYERIVSFLYSMGKGTDEFKMRCLLKISNTADLIYCANQFGLLNAFIQYCQDNKESSQLKKVLQALQNNRK